MSSGDTSAAPEAATRTLRTRSGRSSGAERIPWRITGGPPAPVTPSPSTRSSAAAGVQTSRYTAVEPTSSGSTTNEPIPPMCVSGNWRRLTSAAENSVTAAFTRANDASVERVCSTPFGSAVVPDV
jgi:hypothetical protein